MGSRSLEIALSTFGERLHDSLLAAGIGSVEALAAKARLQDVTLRRALATQGESLSWRQGVTICRALHVRSRWLLDGEGPVAPVVTGDPLEVRALLVLEAIPERKVAYWLGIGKRLSD